MELRILRGQPAGTALVETNFQWSSIFAGACLILGFEAISLMVGNAVGLNANNIVRTDISGALRVWSWIYMAVTFIASNFFGTLLSNRSVGTPVSGALHGLTSWSLATTAVVGIGAIASIGMRALLVGFAPNSVNWITVCVLVLGAVCSAFGGMAMSRAATPIQEAPTTRAA